MINLLVEFASGLFQPAGVDSGFPTKFVANRIEIEQIAMTADTAEVKLSIVIQNQALKSF